MPNSNDKNKTTNVKKWLIDWGFERNEILCLLPNMVEICNWYVNEFTLTPRVCTVYWCLYKHLLWIPPQAVIASRASEGGQCLLITCHWLGEGGGGGGKARARGSRALTVRQGCCRLTTARAVRPRHRKGNNLNRFATLIEAQSFFSVTEWVSDLGFYIIL